MQTSDISSENGLLQLYKLQGKSLADLDTNASGSIDFGELAAALAGKSGSAKTAAAAKSSAETAFARLDANKDGKLSASELGRDDKAESTALELTAAELSGNLLKGWMTAGSTSTSSNTAFAALTGNEGDSAYRAAQALSPANDRRA